MLPMEEKVKRLEKEAENVNLGSYISGAMIPGGILAIVAFFVVGSRYDEKYGFNGSTEAAFCAAFSALVISFVIGITLAILVSCAKTRKAEKIKRSLKHYSGNALVNKFLKSSVVNNYIYRMSCDLSGNIQRTARFKHIREISASVEVVVCADNIDGSRYSSKVDFERERLTKLETREKRKAMAEAIAESVKLRIEYNYPYDINGKVPSVTVMYEEKQDRVRAIVTYKCENTEYEPLDDWNK